MVSMLYAGLFMMLYSSSRKNLKWIRNRSLPGASMTFRKTIYPACMSWYNNDVEVKRWLREHRLVKLHKRLGHALALPSLAAVLRPLKISGQVPGTQHLLRSCARPFGCLCNLTRLRAIGFLLTFTSLILETIIKGSRVSKITVVWERG